MYHEIKSNDDIRCFYEETNSLHDGYIIGIQYEHNGISKIPHGHHFDFEQTNLVLKILVTSISDAVVELVFDGLYEWKIEDNQWDMTDTTVMLDDHNRIIWSDHVYINMAEVVKGTYVIAKSMRWRIAE